MLHPFHYPDPCRTSHYADPQSYRRKSLNYSLEFSGGTSTNVTFNEDMDIKTIDSEVTPVVEEVTGDKNVQLLRLLEQIRLSSRHVP